MPSKKKKIKKMFKSPVDRDQFLSEKKNQKTKSFEIFEINNIEK